MSLTLPPPTRWQPTLHATQAPAPPPVDARIEDEAAATAAAQAAGYEGRRIRRFMQRRTVDYHPGMVRWGLVSGQRRADKAARGHERGAEEARDSDGARAATAEGPPRAPARRKRRAARAERKESEERNEGGRRQADATEQAHSRRSEAALRGVPLHRAWTWVGAQGSSLCVREATNDSHRCCDRTPNTSRGEMLRTLRSSLWPRWEPLRTAKRE
jgi:hypothetical protein